VVGGPSPVPPSRSRRRADDRPLADSPEVPDPVTDARPANGRHRAPRRSWTGRLVARPGGAALKTLAAGTVVSGVAVALATPAQTAVWAMTAQERPADTRGASVSAPSAAAPQAQSFGLIGFSATAKPKPKPKPEPKPAPDPAEARQAETASRSANYSRTGLAGGMSGMSDNAVAVVNEVQRAFPHLDDIGGYRAGDPGDHGSGHAVDIMCGTADGDAVAEHLQGMADTLDIKYIIWKQRIWYPGGGWEPMEDRGDPTQNHYDHVHVSVN
jgi:hypothetical protein